MHPGPSVEDSILKISNGGCVYNIKSSAQKEVKRKRKGERKRYGGRKREGERKREG